MMYLRILFLIGIVFLVSSIESLQPGNWKSCQDGQSIPTRTDTSRQVAALRRKMESEDLDVYIVPTSDFHMSEFVSDYDQKRAYISGFTGSMGTAVITATSAALWTVGKYFLQAEAELGCDWVLMREREAGVPTIEEWIIEQLSGTENGRVGLCPLFFGIDRYLEMKEIIQNSGLELFPIQSDLIDDIWTDGRPEVPTSMLHAVEQYSGRTWQEKIGDVRQQMAEKNIDMVVVTMLDETAWLFNLRGADITGLVKDPFFYSVAIVTNSDVRLFITNPLIKLGHELGGYNGTLADFLSTSEKGECLRKGEDCVKVYEYKHSTIAQAVASLSRSTDIKRILLSYFCNYAMYSYTPPGKVVVDNTPISLLKTRKNPTEVKGMSSCHIRDAAALARFANKLEKGVLAGENWTEISAAEELTRFRSLQDLNRGVSFESISSTGSNAAIIHYFPTNTTDTQISTGETYLIDSGGQYLDGTTDVTRTFYWGEDPPPFIKECYTRVLMGHINLATAVWAKGLYGRDIDAWARQPLFDVGLQYRHGTGHGIGAYLSVHEGPGRISNYHARFAWDIPLDENMFFSDEPGYYEEGKFGIRLENIVYVKKVETKYTMKDVTMLGFETVTLFPYEPHLIDYDLLSDEQISWLNEYSARTLDKVGSLLKEQGDIEAFHWVEKRTQTISRDTPSSSATCMSSFGLICIFCFILSLAF